MNKHINCHAKRDEYAGEARRAISELLSVLHYSLDEYFDKDAEENYRLANQIDITICGRTAKINYFCPNTWEYAEQFLKQNIGFLIVSTELNKFPYYANLAEKFAKDLGCEVEDFDVF